MAIHRGIQSAVFYYLSCAPCAEARYRKKRKEERKRGRIERELLEAENPHIYRQPSPASTNPFWQTEIALGPTLAVRGRRKNNAAGQRAAGAIADNTSAEQSCIDLPENAPDDDPRNDSRWNFRVYQREDEELWGSASNFDAASSYAGSLARPQRALTKDSSAANYHSYRNPEVNDMHPATVTKVNSRDEVAWMLQPPPVAEIMQGKERVSRSRSDSGGSRMMSSSSVSLSRQLSSRLVQNKLKALETAIPMSRESSSRTVSGPPGQSHDRSATTSQRDFAISPVSIETRDLRMPSPVLMSHDVEAFEETYRLCSLTPDTSGASRSRTSIPRPQPSTIPSNKEVSLKKQDLDDRESPLNSKENELPAPPQSRDDASGDDARLAAQFPYVVRDASLKVTGNTMSRSLNGKIIRTHTAPNVKKDGDHRMTGHKHEASDDLMLRPELLETWYTPDFDMGQWVLETTKREVKQRWSMDL